MTKSLTEQWKDGTLTGGIYYCKTKSFGEKKLWFHHRAYDGMYVQTYGTEEMFPEEDIVEVLAPVPSYEEYQRLVSKSDESFGNTELVTKCNRLEKERNAFRDSHNLMCQRYADTELKLQMAIKALKNAHTYKPTTTLKEWCEQKIKEIEEVK